MSSFNAVSDMDNSKYYEHADLEWAIGINRFTLQMIGLWPDETLSSRQKFLANLRAFVIFTTLVTVSIIPSLFSLIRVWSDMIAMIDNLQITLPITATAMKIIIMWLRKEDLTSVVSMVVADWVRTKTEDERDTMIKQARFARRIVVFGCIMMVLAIIIIVIPPCFGYSMRYLTNVTDPGQPLLLQTYYFRDMTQSPYFEIAFVAQTAAVIMAAFSYTGIDNFLGLVVFHICAQMEILRTRFTNLHEYKDFNLGLSTNVQNHMRLIRSIDIIESTFNLMLLALLVYFSIIFCLQGFLIISIIDDGGNVSFPRICWLVSELIITFVHMLLYCVVGEILIAKCEGIYHAVYNYAWYSLKPNEARNLTMIMIRADRPLYITAGKIFPMTLSMFCSVR
ncbi:PREDICTED: odorant receptor 43a-like isoform X2 [Vollenhovia emeryi]|uniref:odorant receptor 43a-like isoform X2 n=1 Tax=Vollenhovia emeryi TaxID=411798 RepID=UPI0005F50D01|nr:PREDICTED: odorant receptor 43a-like isoform X2 [Vollenhovia emeryi]XP_011879044.1 PREDICTED: odorant receptor 43a-like isoform X2 [Vollenhovia emeryi]